MLNLINMNKHDVIFNTPKGNNVSKEVLIKMLPNYNE